MLQPQHREQKEAFVDDNCKLLLHMNGVSGNSQFIDSSNSPTMSFAGTAVGDAKISTAQYKFGVSSLVLDGTGDYVSFPYSMDWQFGSGAVTISAWVYFTNITDRSTIISSGDSGTSNWRIGFYADTGGIYISGSGGLSYQCNWSPTINTWYHIAYIRNGTTQTFYINGVLQTATVDTYSSFPALTTSILAVGTYYYTTSSTYAMFGYIDDLNIWKGVAKTITEIYNTTTPRPIDPYTVLNCKFEGANNSTIFTAERWSGGLPKVVTAYGDAKLSNTHYRFGGTSAYFDGTGDYLLITDTNDLDLPSNFTISFWVYYNAASTVKTILDHGYTDTNGLIIKTDNSADIKLTIVISNSAVITDSSTNVISTWYHYALIREGTTLTLYKNGASVGSVTASNDLTSSRNLSIGADITAANGLNGYIDELIIWKGIAKPIGELYPQARPYGYPIGGT